MKPALISKSTFEKIDPQNIFLVFVFAVTAYLVVPPIILLIISTFQKGLPLETLRFTLKNISTYRDPATYKILLNTLIFVVGSLGPGLTISCPSGSNHQRDL
jgi:ABC-type spermidine/putrescine transport system permease subunit II